MSTHCYVHAEPLRRDFVPWPLDAALWSAFELECADLREATADMAAPAPAETAIAPSTSPSTGISGWLAQQRAAPQAEASTASPIGLFRRLSIGSPPASFKVRVALRPCCSPAGVHVTLSIAVRRCHADTTATLRSRHLGAGTADDDRADGHARPRARPLLPPQPLDLKAQALAYVGAHAARERGPLLILRSHCSKRAPVHPRPIQHTVHRPFRSPAFTDHLARCFAVQYLALHRLLCDVH